MKTMRQMQIEQFNKYYKDNGWPKPVMVGIGIVRIAKDQEEMDKIHREDVKCWVSAIVTSIVLFVVIVSYLP